jgi:hypothetical protein
VQDMAKATHVALNLATGAVELGASAWSPISSGCEISFISYIARLNLKHRDGH